MAHRSAAPATASPAIDRIVVPGAEIGTDGLHADRTRLAGFIRWALAEEAEAAVQQARIARMEAEAVEQRVEIDRLHGIIAATHAWALGLQAEVNALRDQPGGASARSDPRPPRQPPEAQARRDAADAGPGAIARTGCR